MGHRGKPEFLGTFSISRTDYYHLLVS
jgi:hypothetical protein